MWRNSQNRGIMEVLALIKGDTESIEGGQENKCREDRLT